MDGPNDDDDAIFRQFMFVWQAKSLTFGAFHVHELDAPKMSEFMTPSFISDDRRAARGRGQEVRHLLPEHAPPQQRLLCAGKSH